MDSHYIQWPNKSLKLYSLVEIYIQNIGRLYVTLRHLYKPACFICLSSLGIIMSVLTCVGRSASVSSYLSPMLFLSVFSFTILFLNLLCLIYHHPCYLINQFFLFLSFSPLFIVRPCQFLPSYLFFHPLLSHLFLPSCQCSTYRLATGRLQILCCFLLLRLSFL